MCGVVGVFSPSGGEQISQAAYDGLHALNNRGQHGAGITLIDLRTPHLVSPIQGYRGEKPVGEVVTDQGVMLDSMMPAATAALGQIRYPTSGGQGYEGAQPIHLAPYAMVTNGHIEHARDVAEVFHVPDLARHTTDSQYAGATIARVAHFFGLTSAVQQVAPHHNGGAFSSIMTDGREMVAWRDVYGFRPLVLGRLASGGVVFTSETAALDAMRADFERDVRPGEIVTVTSNGTISSCMIQGEIEPGGGICSLEFAYLANKDSFIGGRSVYLARLAMGRELARQHPVDADVVVGVPSGGTLAALGYAAESRIPYADAIERHAAAGRTFMQPTQEGRERMANAKFRVARAAVQGLRVVAVDDSQLRGTVGRVINRKLREAGAAEVHLRISSPMITDVCRMGIDIGDPRELVSNQNGRCEPKIAAALGLDSLGHVSAGGIIKAIREANSPTSTTTVGSICVSCATRRYPFPIRRGQPPVAVQDIPANVSHVL